MREYCKVSEAESLSSTYCQTRLRSVFPLLFTPNKKYTFIPQNSGFFGGRTIAGQNWPYAVLEISNDIPLRKPNGVVVRSGPGLESCRYLIEWAEACCDFNEVPLHPGDNPQDSINEILKELFPDALLLHTKVIFKRAQFP